MNSFKYIVFLVFCFLIAACSKKSEIEPAYKTGLYLPYRQDISPISAFTKNGAVNVQELNLCLQPTTNSGNCIDESLKKVVFSDDSIRLADEGRAWFYFNFLGVREIEYRIETDAESLYFKPVTDEGKLAIKFSPASPVNGIVITDAEEAERYTTKTGRITNEGFSLISYSVITASGSMVSGTTVNYLDLNYLQSELSDEGVLGDAILLYVERETFFRRVN